MARINVVVDNELLELAMVRYGLETKRAAIDLALRRLVGDARYRQRDMLDLHGSKIWEGDLDEMRRGRDFEL